MPDARRSSWFRRGSGSKLGSKTISGMMIGDNAFKVHEPQSLRKNRCTKKPLVLRKGEALSRRAVAPRCTPYVVPANPPPALRDASLLRTSGGLLPLLGFFSLSQSNRSLWVPVRTKYSTPAVSSRTQIRSQSGRMWHSQWPAKVPFRRWALYRGAKGWSSRSLVMTTSNSPRGRRRFSQRLKSFLNCVARAGLNFTHAMP